MRVLLVTDAPPSKDYSGALLTDSLCRLLPAGSVVCYAVMDRRLARNDISADLGIPVRRDWKPRERGVTTRKRFKPPYSAAAFVHELFAEFVACRALAARIRRVIADEGIDRVWCILQGQTMIRVAGLLIRKAGVPVLVQVWDHPDWWLGHNGVDAATASRVRKQYDRVIRGCASFGGASYTMAARAAGSGVRAVSLLASLPEDAAAQEPLSLRDSGRVTIGFAGQMYAREGFELLVAALVTMGWKHRGRDVVLKALGYEFLLKSRDPCSIEYLGYRPQADALDILGGCDLLYCPYVTDPAYRSVAETSFPSKLTTYLATGVPVVFYGPDYSDPYRFLSERGAAFLLPSGTTGAAELAAIIDRALSSPEEYRRVSDAALDAFRSRLTTSVQAGAFMDFITAGGSLP